MARLSRNQSASTAFAIHEDNTHDEAISTSKTRRNPAATGQRSGKQSKTTQTKQCKDADDGNLSTHFTSLQLNEHDQKEDTGRTIGEGETTKKKSRRPLGSTKQNPLLHSLSSSSESGERYSLENMENFRPKSDSWHEEGDSSSSREKRLSDKRTTRTLSRSPRKNRIQKEPSPDPHETGEDGFDSLDDFVVDDDKEISFFQDSDDEEVNEAEDELILQPKTPRRLFRGLPPASARRNGADSNNTSTLPSPKEGSLGLKPNASAPFDLKPTITTENDQDTPVKKSQAKAMGTNEIGANSEKASNANAPGQAGCVTPPTSPSKPRLQSPSKTKNRIPASPHRPSIDAFWNAGTVNDWNDEHSPRKTPGRRELAFRKFDIFSDGDDDDDDQNDSPSERSPAKSPAKSRSGSPTKQSLAAAKKAALQKKRDFDQKKVGLAENFLKELDGLVTGGEIQQRAEATGGVRVVWSKTLNRTAGRANWKREVIRRKGSSSPQKQVTSSCASAGSDVSSSSSLTPKPTTPSTITLPTPSAEPERTVRHHATIELAEKVIDSEDRLLSTLAHEYCHLANYMISNVRDKPHGASFKAWGQKCRTALRNHPVYAGYDVEISTKHSYEINFKYVWCCRECGREYGRHSKSIDPKKQRCALCEKGVLVQVRPKPRKQKAASAAAAAAAVPAENKENQDPVSSPSKGSAGLGGLMKSLELVGSS